MKISTALLGAIVLSLSGWVQASGIRSAGIDHVGINVPDLKQAQEFLATTFGCQPVTHIGPFEMAPRAASVSLAMVRCGSGANIELFEYKQSTGSTAMPNSEDRGASHIAFYTDDVPAGVAYLKSQGVTVLGEPVVVNSGDTAGETWVHFLSPWGSEMELVGYPRGKGYETHANVRLWDPRHPAN
jgi:catechol 2,3-dioxygenase-like lactoylglutathione lyase family enzyme